MNTSPDHPDFTALALGEHIHGTPARALLEMMRSSVAARSEAEKIRTTAELLAFALKRQQPAGLDAARRDAIFIADPATVRARFAAEKTVEFTAEPEAPPARVPRTWVYPTAAAAAVGVAAILVMRLLPGYTAPSHRNSPAVSESATAPPGKIMVTAPPAGAQARQSIPAGPPAPAIATQESKLPPPDKGTELPAPHPPPPSVFAKDPPTPPAVPADVPAAPPSGKPAPSTPLLDDFATPPPPKKRSR